MIEQEEVFFSEEESLQLIVETIRKAKCDFIETGISALMWGSIVTFCALVQFASAFYNIPWAEYVWFLTFFAVIPQIIISIRETKKKKYKTYHDDTLSGIWIAFGIVMFLLSFYISTILQPGKNITYDSIKADTLYLIIYGFPTFATGFARRFTPMVIGGVACWIFAIVSVYVSYPYTMLLIAGAALLAWFIPGLILQSRYQKAKKQQHV